MRLSTFILDNIETILQEWEEFAATLVPAEHKTDRVILRDHAKKMLNTIAADLARPQTAHEQSEKSKGHDDSPAKETPADTHGAERLALGFSLNEAMSEYRALRASVTRLWEEALRNKPVPNIAFDDLIRFNEAIDQAISESVTSYSFEKEQQTRVFDTILSSSPDLSFTVDLDGRLAYANKALIELLELLQIGVEAVDLVMIIQDEKGMQRLLSSNFQVSTPRRFRQRAIGLRKAVGTAVTTRRLRICGLPYSAIVPFLTDC